MTSEIYGLLLYDIEDFFALSRSFDNLLYLGRFAFFPSIQAEGYRQGKAYTYLLTTLLTGCPVGHATHYAQCLGIEQGIYRANYGIVADTAILVYHKLHNHTALHTIALCLLGILDIRLQELHHFFHTTGEHRLLFYRQEHFALLNFLRLGSIGYYLNFRSTCRLTLLHNLLVSI